MCYANKLVATAVDKDEERCKMMKLRKAGTRLIDFRCWEGRTE